MSDMWSIRISKEIMAGLPPWFEETPLGLPMGARAQYRGPKGLHVREYDDFYEVHFDAFDPREHPLLHLLLEFLPMASRKGR
ncbi:MAG: hypothetical protein ACP5NG_04700 [Conexivisphaera sp.]